MNKRFSTLLCASLLASAGMSVNAQELPGAIRGEGAKAVTYFESAKPSGVYQLRVLGTDLTSSADDEVLIVNNGKYYLVKPGAVDVKSTLWCAQIFDEHKGQEPIYDFINKSAQTLLAYDKANEAKVGQIFSGWALSPSWTKTDPLKEDMPMYTYTTKDKILVLKKGATTTLGTVPATEVITVEEKPSKNLDLRDEAQKAANKAAGYVYVTLYDAGAYVLSANEVNAYLKDNAWKLTFKPDANADVNPFSTQKFEAKEATASADDHNFVYVVKKDADKKTYLKVDTAANGVGIEFLKFGWSNTAETKYATALTGPIANQHKFLFTYKPSVDSLYIQVQEARFRDDKADHNKKGNWINVVPTQYGSAYHDIFCEGDDPADKLFVKLQNFTVAERIATIGTKAINTHIGFGVEGCSTSNNKTSMEEGLYIITNAKGQVLAAPIHLNDNSGNNEAQFVTLDEQEPLHMPAYQWVVEKTNQTTKLLPVSPIQITNREFENLKSLETQLTLDDNNKVVENIVVKGETIDMDKVTFTKIKDANTLTNKKLGYRFVPSDSLRVNKYVFHYLNPFTDNHWMATEKDSLNYVRTAATRYNLVEGSTNKYGYNKADVMKRIGFVQLERTNYEIQSANGTKSFVEAYNEKYSMGAINYTFGKPGVEKIDKFFFKENNHYSGEHYYAIVESSNPDPLASADIEDVEETKKAGLADDGKSAVLKVQLLNESRTSAFTVEPDEIPLYRRFNNTNLKESKTDAHDSLIFVEKVRNEYLMDEWNKNLLNDNVDYAGIWAKDKANGKLVFNIDTAWVNRGLGYIKPQYLISVDRHVIDKEIVVKPCEEGTPHVRPDGTITDDPSECVHAKREHRSYAVAKYLVNFADSAKAVGLKKPYMDIDGGYTRVGFVKALKFGDSLVVLTNGFEKVAYDKIDTAAIFKNYREHGLMGSRVIDLRYDNHKNVTWSFRYVTPSKEARTTDKEGEVNEFLFESNIYDVNGAMVSGSIPAGKVNLSNKGNYGKGSIAPNYAAWLKMQNGCLVLTRGDSKFEEAKTASDGALIFNVIRPSEKDDFVTSNEEVAVEGVQVIAGNGVINVQGAAGETVTVCNILGQTLATQTLSSDNATIAVPQGIAVVTVAGETLKVVVK